MQLAHPVALAVVTMKTYVVCMAALAVSATAFVPVSVPGSLRRTCLNSQEDNTGKAPSWQDMEPLMPTDPIELDETPGKVFRQATKPVEEKLDRLQDDLKKRLADRAEANREMMLKRLGLEDDEEGTGQ